MTPHVTITIRPIRRVDMDAVAKIYGASFDEPWPRPVVEGLYFTPAAWGLLASIKASEGDIPVGFILARTVIDEADIMSIGVHPQHRCKGVGRTLVDAVIHSVNPSQGGVVILEVAEDNPAAQNLYASAGFKVVGRRPGYYIRVGNVKVAALLMRYAIDE